MQEHMTTEKHLPRVFINPLGGDRTDPHGKHWAYNAFTERTNTVQSEFLSVAESDSLRDADRAEIEKLRLLVQEFGDNVTDMFEQMVKGKWRDELGHPVNLNDAINRCADTVEKAIKYRAALGAKGTG